MHQYQIMANFKSTVLQLQSCECSDDSTTPRHLSILHQFKRICTLRLATKLLTGNIRRMTRDFFFFVVWRSDRIWWTSLSDSTEKQNKTKIRKKSQTKHWKTDSHQLQKALPIFWVLMKITLFAPLSSAWKRLSCLVSDACSWATSFFRATSTSSSSASSSSLLLPVFSWSCEQESSQLFCHICTLQNTEVTVDNAILTLYVPLTQVTSINYTKRIISIGNYWMVYVEH